MQETQVQFLAQEDPLEKEMTIHSSIVAWKIPWTEEPGALQSVDGVEKSQIRFSDKNNTDTIDTIYKIDNYCIAQETVLTQCSAMT